MTPADYHSGVAGGELARDDLMAIALARERRRLVRHLHAHAPCDIGEAVRAVGDDPNESHLVHSQLRDDHLPLLEAHDVVEFDGEVIRVGDVYEPVLCFVWDLDDAFESLGIPAYDAVSGGEA